ncbi:MAG: NFACT family protein [Acutalibacteraceae bacterium]
MALDGAFLRFIKTELEEKLVGLRVEKVFQPNRDELIVAFRGVSGAYKVLMSARANSPRVNITQYPPENPQTPPMLCMLLRKRLTGARLKAITQHQLERVLRFTFDATDELGDKVELSLIAEIMGKYSNVIFVDSQDTIIDALKRVDMTMSSQRLVLPGIKYQLPPPQDKLNPIEASVGEIIGRIKNSGKAQKLNKAILTSVQGFSPIVCRELEHLTGRGAELDNISMTDEQYSRLEFFLKRTVNEISDNVGVPCMVQDLNGKPIDFSFMNILQYGTAAKTVRIESYSELLDSFYLERDKAERMRVKGQDLLRLLTNITERLTRKINTQKIELANSEDREQLRIKGDLIQANLYRIEKGSSETELENFYDENMPKIKIKLNPALTPGQNAQKYYKDYRKAKNAQQYLTVEIEKAQQELLYIDTVFDSLSRAETERELAEIKQELIEGGYIKRIRSKQKIKGALPPLEFTSKSGLKILVGRNNVQNDKLTLKTAKNYDLWFHTKDIPGSHTVIVSQGETPDDETILYAAQLAAYHSRAKDSSKVPVDYTLIKYVSKVAGAKPGMVIYKNQKTLFVKPSLEQG